MFTAVSMGIFDRLQERPRPPPDTGRAPRRRSGATARLLDGCAALGLLEKRDDRLPQRAGCRRPTSARVEPPHLDRLHPLFRRRALSRCGANLEDAVREARPAGRRPSALDGPIFSGFFRTDEAMRDFLMGMHGFGMLTSPKRRGSLRPGPLSPPGGSRRRHRTPGHGRLRTIPRHCAPRSSICRASPPWRARHGAQSPAAGRIEIVGRRFLPGRTARRRPVLPRPHPPRLDRAKIELLLRRICGPPARRRRSADRRKAAGRRWRRGRSPPTCSRSTCWS